MTLMDMVLFYAVQALVASTYRRIVSPVHPSVGSGVSTAAGTITPSMPHLESPAISVDAQLGAASAA